MSSLVLNNDITPSPPREGRTRLYADTQGRLIAQNFQGVEQALTGVNGGVFTLPQPVSTSLAPESIVPIQLSGTVTQLSTDLWTGTDVSGGTVNYGGTAHRLEFTAGSTGLSNVIIRVTGTLNGEPQQELVTGPAALNSTQTQFWWSTVESIVFDQEVTFTNSRSLSVGRAAGGGTVCNLDLYHTFNISVTQAGNTHLILTGNQLTDATSITIRAITDTAAAVVLVNVSQLGHDIVLAGANTSSRSSTVVLTGTGTTKISSTIFQYWQSTTRWIVTQQVTSL